MSRNAVSSRCGFLTAVICTLAIAACEHSISPGSEGMDGGMARNLAQGEPNAANDDTAAFIGAWLDGEAVQLRYTRSYNCEEPPQSQAASGCELGAGPEDFPRGGRLPMIYALAPIGFTPSDPSTLHCSPSNPCGNHPAMIDVSRLNIPNVVLATRPPHSHIITSRQAGWHNTVNIRVLSLAVWNQIAAEPSLETVRQLQADYPTLISQDIPTNIFFFFHVNGNGE